MSRPRNLKRSNNKKRKRKKRASPTPPPPKKRNLKQSCPTELQILNWTNIMCVLKRSKIISGLEKTRGGVCSAQTPTSLRLCWLKDVFKFCLSHSALYKGEYIRPNEGHHIQCIQKYYEYQAELEICYSVSSMRNNVNTGSKITNLKL